MSRLSGKPGFRCREHLNCVDTNGAGRVRPFIHPREAMIWVYQIERRTGMVHQPEISPSDPVMVAAITGNAVLRRLIIPLPCGNTSHILPEIN
ncbi:hypothetical protein Mpal_0641 [Methanosphaerula palustris E1-9c]|uniref:Uncharacterized protein n=1 Tax=Methanosphaerula palustris (strain ATCC BAA-1556 / DSM 19958 / E1-9c) TaxID=521011 RepID=B8GFG4_METPE|nr:hypothetical protein Mpal_0641 [Methanosphaerula palustris E1-9c]